MPEIFHDLPVRELDDDEAVGLLEELVEKALPGAAEDDRTTFGLMCALGVGDLRAAGVEYAGICVIAVDGVPCTATVSVTLVDSPDSLGVPGAVREISSGLRRTAADEVSELELPCGSAVLCIGRRESEFPAELTDSSESFTFPTTYIRVWVPLPNGTTVVTEMGTATMTGWDAFSTMFGNIVSSIRLFRADGTPLITSRART
ncbi:hypothetical protein ACIREM_06720 [Streptomyces shenzhenensis]|uniref:hypothetical protein n=1 Tax=Streptomyces shenzhenensis TaxID=943815 RepID=UPI0037F19F10